MSNGKKHIFLIPEFKTEAGQVIKDVSIAYETWGKLNKTADNAILVNHALTGTSYVTSNGVNGSPGWWEYLVGPWKAIDTNKHFVICSNVLGGCSGTTGPSSTDPETGKPYGITFPVITVRDFVRYQKHLIDHLGVRKLHSVVGASMGGMNALEWAAMYPEQVHSVIAIGAPGKAYPQSIAFRKSQRKAIMMDPNWNEGNYYGNSIPEKGIELARMIGFITYRTDKEFADKFGREHVEEGRFEINGRFQVESYLEYHGKKLANWFDANTYLYLSKAMDLYDLGFGFSSFQKGVQRIKARTLMIGQSSDMLFPVYQQKEVIEILKQRNNHAYYSEIQTNYGHDAFLLEEEQMSQTIRKFLKEI